MKYETANRIYKTARSGTTDGRLQDLSNVDLEMLADMHSLHTEKNNHGNQGYQPSYRSRSATDDLYDLCIARARLKEKVRSTPGNHIAEAMLISELNKRIWKLDKKSHIRAMAARSY